MKLTTENKIILLVLQLQEAVKSKKLLHVLKKMTVKFPDGDQESVMLGQLNYAEELNLDGKEVIDHQVIVAYFNKRPIGWALLIGGKKTNFINVFVKKTYRRFGVGGELVDQLKNLSNKRLHGSYYSTESEAFFKQCKIKGR